MQGSPSPNQAPFHWLSTISLQIIPDKDRRWGGRFSALFLEYLIPVPITPLYRKHHALSEWSPAFFSHTTSRLQGRWWDFWSHYSTVPPLPCFAAHFIADPYHHPNQQVVWSLSQSLLLQKVSIFFCLALEKWTLGLWSWCSRDRIWRFFSSFSSLLLGASDSHRFFLSQFPFYFIAMWLASFMSVNPQALTGTWAMPKIGELLSDLCYLVTWIFYFVLHMCVSM